MAATPGIALADEPVPGVASVDVASASPTAGWTQYGETCEYKIDDQGCLTLRPLGDGASATIESLDFSSTVFSSFKVENEIHVTKSLKDAFKDDIWLKSADLTGIVTDDAADVSNMFNGCSGLDSVTFPTSGFAICNSTSGMFNGCSALKTVDLSSVTASGSVSAEGMFKECSSLESVAFPADGLTISNTAGSMFLSCEKLSLIDLSGVKTDGAISADGMFERCGSLKSVVLPKSFEISNAELMFEGCEKLASIDLSGVRAESAIDADSMFSSCSALTSVDFPESFRVSSAEWMFQKCTALKSVNLNNLVTSDAIQADHMFSECSALESVAFPSNFKVASTWCLFYNCKSLETADLSGMDTRADGTVSYMFSGCSSLKSADLSSFSAFKATDLTSMFSGCSSLETLDLASFNTAFVTNMNSMFDGCSSLKSLDLSNFDTSSVKDMSHMFRGCSALKSLDISGMNTAKLESVTGMFSGTFPLSVTVGKRFGLNAQGQSVSLPSDASIWGDPSPYTGKWVSSVDGKTYAANQIPSNVAATYTAEKLRTTVQAPQGQELKYNGAEQTGVAPGEGYSVTGNVATEPGSYTAKLSLNDKEGCVWSTTGTSDDIEVAWSISEPDYTWCVDEGSKSLSITLYTSADVSWSFSDPSVASVTGTRRSLIQMGSWSRQVADVDFVLLKAGYTELSASVNGTVVSTATIRVTPSTRINASKASVKVADQAWTGEPVTPAPTVALGGKTLAAGTDYDVSYANNVDEGTATVTVTFRGNYYGTAKGTFAITKKDSGSGSGSSSGSGSTQPAASKVTMYRLYNKYTGEHFYTADKAEKDNLANIGWTYEGVGWTAPSKSSTPVYRLYNKYVPGGDHHYTTDKDERDACIAAGWTYEEIGWYSDDAKGTPLYRQYNPYAVTGTHNYTVDKKENDCLVSLGWRAEGISWYGVK